MSDFANISTPAWDRVCRMAGGVEFAETHSYSEIVAEAQRLHPLNCQCQEFCAPLADWPHPYDDEGRLKFP